MFTGLKMKDLQGGARPKKWPSEVSVSKQTHGRPTSTTAEKRNRPAAKRRKKAAHRFP
jgi:hypothetical protein